MKRLKIELPGRRIWGMIFSVILSCWFGFVCYMFYHSVRKETYPDVNSSFKAETTFPKMLIYIFIFGGIISFIYNLIRFIFVSSVTSLISKYGKEETGIITNVYDKIYHNGKCGVSRHCYVVFSYTNENGEISEMTQEIKKRNFCHYMNRKEISILAYGDYALLNE